MVFAVILFMIILGIIMILISTTKILTGKYSSQSTWFPIIFGNSSHLFRVFAEYFTAIALIAGAIALYMNLRWGLFAALFALVALVYISLRSIRWRIDQEAGIFSDIPGIVGFIVGAVSIIILILNFQ